MGLPRGMLHDAKTGGTQYSLHLTLTIPSHDFTWAKFATHAISQLLMSQTGTLRQMVPAGIAMGQEEGNDETAAIPSQVIEAAKEGLTMQAAQEHFSKKIQNHNRSQDNVAAVDFAFLPHQIHRDSQMRLKKGMGMSFENDPDKKSQLCKMIVRNKGRTLEQTVDRTHITVYHAIAATKGEAFTIHELPGDGYSEICVVKLLLKQEVLEIFEHPAVEAMMMEQMKGQKGGGKGKGKGKSMPAITEGDYDDDDDGELLYSG